MFLFACPRYPLPSKVALEPSTCRREVRGWRGVCSGRPLRRDILVCLNINCRHCLSLHPQYHSRPHTCPRCVCMCFFRCYYYRFVLCCMSIATARRTKHAPPGIIPEMNMESLGGALYPELYLYRWVGPCPRAQHIAELCHLGGLDPVLGPRFTELCHRKSTCAKQ